MTAIHFVRRLVAAAGLATLATAYAQDYPTRTITIVSPTTPGGAVDAISRIIADSLSTRLGQSVIVEAKPGGAGAVGGGFVARAPADGYTLLMAADTFLTVTPHLTQGFSFDPLKDLAPVAEVGTLSMVLLVNPALGIKTLDGFLGRARTSPGKITFASAGPGSPHQLAMETLMKKTESRLTHVPYKGGSQAFADVVGGHADSMFILFATARTQVEAGKVIVLGTSAPKRMAELPDVPAIAERVPGFEQVFWFGVFAPAATPQPIVDKLSKEIGAVVTELEVVKKFQALGIAPLSGSPQALAERVQRDYSAAGQLLKDIGLKAK